MKHLNHHPEFAHETLTGITGSPKIGEGNIITAEALDIVLKENGIDMHSFFPEGMWVKIGNAYHIRMSESINETMKYALDSADQRNALKARPLKAELKRAVQKAVRKYPNATFFITPQSMMAEEAVGNLKRKKQELPVIMICPDAEGKLIPGQSIDNKQRKLYYFVWNQEAEDRYLGEYNLDRDKVHLIKPVDPIKAVGRIDRSDLPFQEALKEPKTCFIKLSGSGGDANMVNAAITALWKNSGVRSIVFPGLEKTKKKIIKTIGDGKVHSNLKAKVFYNQVRHMISEEQMMLTYPSEQVLHLRVLSENNIRPKVVWLPPRGQHEIVSLAWAIKQGFSTTICSPEEYWSQIAGQLQNFGINPKHLEFVEPDKLSMEHFKVSPILKAIEGAVPISQAVRTVVSR